MEGLMIATEQKSLTTTEAAVVSGVSVRNVNRVIDEKILPESLFEAGPDGVRRLNADACVFISFYFGAANRLTSDERLRIIATASKQLSGAEASAMEKEWIIRQEFLTVDLAPFLRGVRQRLEKLSAARAMVVEDPEILSGTPVIQGTRVPVYYVAASVEAGEPMERILEDYPRLTAEDVELAALYAEAIPPRGRPRPSAPLPAGAVIVAHYRVPARHAATRKLAS
jgi:uncharacterized protein (DUF433 family)